MVARPGAISLPLTGGQNQKVDERILAPQEFTEVTNVVQTRDGRQQARRGFSRYPVYTVAGQTMGVAPIRCVGDGDLFVADSGDLPFWTYAYRAGVRSRVGGGTADSGYATAPLKSVGDGGICSLIPERVIPTSNYRGEQEQTSATCDYSETGEWLVTANLDAGAISVVWRSRDSLEVVASYRVTPDAWSNPDSNSNYVQCSVVADTTSNKTAVVAVKRSGAVFIIYFADAGDTPTLIDTTQTVLMNTNENCCIDTCTIASTDSFTVAMPQAAGVFLRNYTFGSVLDLNWSTNVFSPTTQYTMVTVDTAMGEHLWAVASTDPAAAVRSLRMGRVSVNGTASATSALTTLSAGRVPGIPFCTHAGRLGGSTQHCLAYTYMSSGLPRAEFAIWDGVNTSAIHTIADVGQDYGVVAGRVFLNDIDGEYYENSTFRRLLVPMMQSGYSPLDTDLAFDPGRPVFLMSIGAGSVSETEGGWVFTYQVTAPAEQGLLALSGEVGQSTHPLISYMASGTTGWTMGAPSKNVRITSNSGDVDTGLTGAYALTFDVAPPGKLRKFAGTQWTQAMHGLPRQGRLALFRPMKAQHCELEPIRANETLIPGLTATVCDGTSTHSCGFLEAPVITELSQGAGTSGLVAGTYSVTAVFEWVDASGRRYQSAPAVPRDVTVTTLNNYVEVEFAEPVACYDGASVTVYRTPVGGSEFKRDGSFMSSNSANNTFFQLTDNQLAVQETLYTSLGEVPNDPPPSAQRFARTRDRVWAYGLDRPEVVQASKLLTDARGIVWSNAPNYFLVLPEDVVAVETLDETAVVFTGSAVYTIGGSGPGDDGIGAFTEPGRIPGYVGCISPRSVISADAGIFFISQRGIELLPRGFGAAQWIGQPVMDDLATYSECRGVTADPENDLIIWSMVSPTTWAERLLVYDVRAQTWSKWNVPETGPGAVSGTSRAPTVGLSVGGENPVRTSAKVKRPILWGDTSSRVRIQDPTSALDYWQDSSGVPNEDPVTPIWESGWMRFAGVSGWQIVRRMTILCTPLNDDWVLSCHLSYNDNPAIAGSAEWDWSEITYTLGQSLTLELALPVVQFESLRVLLNVEGNGELGPSMQVHSVMLHSENDGARLPRTHRR